MENEQSLIPQKKSTGDYVHTIAKAGLGSLPIIGTAASELFAFIISPPLEKRRNEWMNNIAERLINLESEKKVDIAALADNEAFITTVMNASHIAIRNHQQEKLLALGNAISNAALPNSPDDTRELLFLNYIDKFTVWHIRILYLFQDSKNWFLTHNKKAPEFGMMSSYEQVLLSAYPELSNSRSIYDIIDNDLNEAGLFTSSGLHTTMSSTGAHQKRTTELGDEFLRFISKP